ncbi:MAG: AAA family ATPase [Candidatus Symbiothrix sp.]|jgi:predicted AAA+ superfamily ATPase|nr:AAA family ATPase [Candidatus Symbiothrix sp.]
MYRKITKQLIDWKQDNARKPLIMEGARQTGKTYILQYFGKEYYRNVAYVNMENASDELKQIFTGSINPVRIVQQLEIMFGFAIHPAETLLIFDEVQEIPRALTSLKYFCEEAPEYNVVASGSLLGIFLHPGSSFPVGKVDFLKMQPMNFEEFLIANNEQRLVDFARENPKDLAFLKEKLYDYFKYYLVTGGMPEVVQSWITEKNIEKVEKIQDAILQTYIRDFSKHTKEAESIRIKQVFDSLPKHFAKNNDKFLYDAVREGARAREYELAIEWLLSAGIVRRVNLVKCGDKLPLRAYSERNSFKLYFIDVGLFRRFAKIPTAVVLDKTAIFDEFNGLLAEQYVLQELNKYELFYWRSSTQAEVDFVTQIDSKIVPIEVKSGLNVKSQSMKVYRERFNPELAIRFSLKETKMDGNLLNISLYHSPFFDYLLKSHYSVLIA